MRLILVTFAVSLLLVPAAAAATIDAAIDPSDVDLGTRQTVSGSLLEGTAPVAGQQVALEVRRHPYEGDWREVKTATTAEDGSYSFKLRLRRNHKLRVVAPTATSDGLTAFVFPATTLSFKARNPRVIKLKQRYETPRKVELNAPTRFYVGRQGAEFGKLEAVADVVERKPGVWKSKATIRIPDAWDGRFRYGSCFAYSPGSGMGDPDASCPERKLRL